MKFHGIFLFLSSGDFPAFIDKHWQDLNALTGDYMDIYFSKEDLNRRSSYETLNDFKTLEVRLDSLPALVPWQQSLKEAVAVSLGKLPHDEIVHVVKMTVQAIRDGDTAPRIAENATKWIQKKLNALHFATAEFTQTKIIVNGENVNLMRDKYDVSGQAAAVGPQAHVHDITFQQLWNQASSKADSKNLLEGLARLRLELKKHATTAEHDEAVGEIAAAERAAKAGDGPQVMMRLKKAGKWALEVAEKIGVGVVVALLKDALK